MAGEGVRRATHLHIIDGQARRVGDGRTRVVRDHAGQPLGVVAEAEADDVAAAVAAAARAQPPWAQAPPLTRSRGLFRAAERLERRRGGLAALVAASEGTTASRARDLVDAAIERWAWYAGWADKYRPVAVDDAGPDRTRTCTRPVGVVAITAPQESSLVGLVSVLAPVLVAGNTAVVAASERRPLPALAVAELVTLAGLPPGVVNVLTGTRETLGVLLAAHDRVDALDLTGWIGHDTTAGEEAAAPLTVVLRPVTGEPDVSGEPAGPRRILAFCATTSISSAVDV